MDILLVVSMVLGMNDTLEKIANLVYKKAFFSKTSDRPNVIVQGRYTLSTLIGLGKMAMSYIHS